MEGEVYLCHQSGRCVGQIALGAGYWHFLWSWWLLPVCLMTLVAHDHSCPTAHSDTWPQLYSDGTMSHVDPGLVDCVDDGSAHHIYHDHSCPTDAMIIWTLGCWQTMTLDPNYSNGTIVQILPRFMAHYPVTVHSVEHIYAFMTFPPFLLFLNCLQYMQCEIGTAPITEIGLCNNELLHIRLILNMG